MIQLSNIDKTFRVAKRNTGFRETVKALFKKEYEFIHALKDVSFEIGTGEMVGFIGPNGAGKSSTIKIMSGILIPDSGECIINGLTPWKSRKAHAKNIGVVFGQRSQLWRDVPVIDSFELIRDIYKIEPAAYKKNFSELTEMLHLSEIVRTPARSLSLGQRMRCEIAASMLHGPAVLFLDEPTVGLDAVSKIAVREFIKRINRERNTTVILTTREMQDIEGLTERILLIGKGRILLDGSLSELKKRCSPNKTVTLKFSSGDFEPVAGITQKSRINGHAVFVVDTDKIPISDAISLLSKRADITDISIAGTSAEELADSLYEELKL